MNVQQQAHYIKAGTPVSDLEVMNLVESDEHANVGSSEDATFLNSVSATSARSDDVPEYIEKLMEKVDPATPESAVLGLQELLLSNRHIFCETENELGRTDVLEHRIDTAAARPVRQQLRRFPPAHVEAISEQVDSMLAQGVIEPAWSPWASNIVLVRKKDGSLRCCIDYRRLNDVTVKDAYPLPRIDQSLEAMTQAQWFSSCDLKAAYHQIQVSPEDRDKTAFICPRGMYRFRTMPFGLCNAGATFQRLMDVVMSGLHLEVCLVYLDDIVVYARTPEEHLQRLAMVFDRLSRAGLKLKPEKCRFFQRSVKFLGHVVSHEGIGTDPEKIRAVVEWPTPTSVSDTRSFLGLASYYRRFVRNFAEVAAPLHALTKKDAKFVWTEEAQRAFEALQAALISPPILAMPTDEGEFVVDTDASDRTIGAVLSQSQDGIERVIAYASRALDSRERNYCVSRKELLAIVHFLKYFKQYLLGRRFKVRTDHSALMWLRKTPEPIGQQARWCEQLEEFDFVVEHRPGVKHGNADALSRRPCPKKECACKEPGSPLFGGPADPPRLRAAAIVVPDDASPDRTGEDGVRSRESAPHVEVVSDGEVGEGSPSPHVEATPQIDLWELDALQRAQKNDPDIAFVYKRILAADERPSWNDVSACSHDTKVLWSFWPRLVVREGVLMRRFDSEDGKVCRYQVVLPKSLREQFLELTHSGAAGHLGFKKSAAAVQARAYWPTWSSDLSLYIKRCNECSRYHRGTLPRHAEMQTPRSGEPWERVSLDITGPHPRSSRQNKYILSIVDHFSKWAEAIPLSNHTAPIVARALVVHVISRFGTPLQILTDRGTEFESELFTHLMKWLGVEKLRTTVFKPSTNGIVERFHRTLNSMLGKAVSESQKDWDDKLPFVMAAYRSSVHSSTGYSPNKLFLGRENRMPVDLAKGLPLEESYEDGTFDDYVARQQEIAEQSYRLVREHLQTNSERRKAAYDTRVRKMEFEVGSWVWYFYPRRYSGKSPKWQKNFVGPFLVVRQLPPVNYVIQRSKCSKPFVVHTDKLKTCLGETPVSWIVVGSSDVTAQAEPCAQSTPSAVIPVCDIDSSVYLSQDKADPKQHRSPVERGGGLPHIGANGERSLPTPRRLPHSYRHQLQLGATPQPHSDHAQSHLSDNSGRRVRRKIVPPRYLNDYVC